MYLLLCLCVYSPICLIMLSYLPYLVFSYRFYFCLISSHLISSHLIYLSVYLKWSTSAGLPQVDVHSTKTKQFFKTPSILEIDKVKKGSDSVRLLSRMESLSADLTASYLTAFCDFEKSHVSKVPCACQVIQVVLRCHTLENLRIWYAKM